jgi:hypothetical protein
MAWPAAGIPSGERGPVSGPGGQCVESMGAGARFRILYALLDAPWCAELQADLPELRL